MRIPFVFSVMLVGLVACGGDDDGGATDAAVNGPDARVIIDAEPGPDAKPAALGCLGDALPTVAVDPLSTAGQAVTLSGTSLVAAEGVSIEPFENDGSLPGTSLGAAVLSDSVGQFEASVATGGTPLDAYLAASLPGYLPTYLFHAYAATESLVGVQLPVFTADQLDLLAGLGQVTITPGQGFILVAVVDCDGEFVEGATVDAVGGGTVRYLSDSNVPDSTRSFTSSNGLAVIFNVAPGPVVLDGQVGGADLRDNDVLVAADSLTVSVLVP